METIVSPCFCTLILLAFAHRSGFESAYWPFGSPHHSTGIHGCHNYATVGTVASVATKVPQFNNIIVSEMRTAILIKKKKKINGS